MENHDLQKEAALAIRGLQKEKEDLQSENTQIQHSFDFYKRASALAFKLNSSGSIAIEDIPEAIQNFSEETENELAVIEKAAELSNRSGKTLSFGSLSETTEENGLSPEEVFANALLND